MIPSTMPLVHFKRIAGTLDEISYEISYAPCGVGISRFGLRPTDEPQASPNSNDVTCAACIRWLRDNGKRR